MEIHLFVPNYNIIRNVLKKPTGSGTDQKRLIEVKYEGIEVT